MLAPFKLEEYFSKYEFSIPFMLGSSDPQTCSLSELLTLATNEQLELWENLRLGYTETHGAPLLRQEISQLYNKQMAENILVFSGAEEAIYVTMRVLLQPGDHVVLITPCYQSLKELPRAFGAKITEVALEWDNQQWLLDFNKLENAITEQTKLVIINFPNNPTGYTLSKQAFNEIINIVKQKGIYLFSDEVYRLSEQNAEDRLPNAADCYENALSVSVMSKSFGLPGLRIGWLCTQNKELLQQLSTYKNYTSMCNSAPSELLATIALSAKDTLLQHINAITKSNLDLLDQFFAKYQDAYTWYRPRASFVSFPRLLLNIPIEQFAAQLVEEEGVLLVPGTLFDNTTNHFRLGFGRQNLPEALVRLERFTKKLLDNL